MTRCGELIDLKFSGIDEQLKQYVEDVLTNGADDFADGEEVYEAVGDVLKEVASGDMTDDDIRSICDDLLKLLRPDTSIGDSNSGDSSRKILTAPVHLGAMAAELETKMTDVKSIWVNSRDGEALKVDSRKLEKAEAKLQEKQEKRKGGGGTAVPSTTRVNSTATASQVTSKKDAKMEAKGTNRTQDIRIENFDISYGDKVLLAGADLLLAAGRRYGLVGRNGIGKTTLLRMIATRQLQIQAHVSILHVEQEVIGDETTALDSVLECDVRRETLLAEEKRLSGLQAPTGAESERLSEVYIELANIDSDSAPSRASRILNGLGFDVKMQKMKTKEFSGGWRMRLALARALFSRPDLLLLDEPTNMLDMKAIIWLETYLQSWPTTLLVVSHDRNFLDSVPTDIIHLRGQKLYTYRGNYAQFVKTMTEKLKNQQREYDAQMAHRAHVQEFIDRFRYNANRASSVQSKIKMLEKLPELEPIEKEPEVILRFPEVDPLSPPILQLAEVFFRYESDRWILRNVNLSATLESRVCVVGDNGAGKTTLLKIIMGQLTPTSGTRHVHRNLKFGYFAQHHVDQLAMNVSCVELLQRSIPGKPIEEYRRQLGSFGVTGDMALQSVGSLSGGQKSRVAFARMCAEMPNFLVLDEPTNHLDIETIEALGKAINAFKGGLILVSHDERLIRMVCKELWHCSQGEVKSIEGGFDEYRKIVEMELNELNK